VNENLNHVGTVFDIFGPVSAPYVAVKPETATPKSLLNHILYAVPSQRRERKKRK